MLIRFVAVVMTGLALIAPGAHLYELSNKIVLARDQYFVVQSIYSGWWIAGLLLPLSFLINVALAWVSRESRIASVLALGAALCTVINMMIFYFFTYPANVATNNWTVIPEDWETLRRQWELSHAANAGIAFIAFCLSTAAALKIELGPADRQIGR